MVTFNDYRDYQRNSQKRGFFGRKSPEPSAPIFAPEYVQSRPTLRKTQQDREWKRSAARIHLAAAVTGAIFFIIAAKMSLSTLSNTETQNSGLIGHDYQIRANIVDRNNEIFATNMPAFTLYLDYERLIDKEGAIAGLLEIFPQLNKDELVTLFEKKKRGQQFLIKQISPEQRIAVLEIGEPGLQFGTRELRVYPNAALAAHSLGGVNIHNMDFNHIELTGQAGIELGMDSYLTHSVNTNRPLKLALDLSAQFAVEDELAQAIAHFNAEAGLAVLMEADTGRIVSLASLPDFDPNTRPQIWPNDQPASQNPRFNRAVLGMYEFGSTFKLFTAALALDSGYANLDSVFPVGRSVEVMGRTIPDFHYAGENLTLEDIIVKSSNVGTVRIVQGMGTQAQQEFLRRLGLLEPTKLELPEARQAQPLFPSDKDWTALSTATISYGYGLSVSSIHLASAYASLVNGGYKVSPSLLYDLSNQPPRERVVSEETSKNIRKILRKIVISDDGTASFARTDGYDIGGKTGTAEKRDQNGQYLKNQNINTFASAFPMSDPQYVLVVTLDNPKDPEGNLKRQTAGWTSVPTAANIIKRVAPILGVDPVYSSETPIE